MFRTMMYLHWQSSRWAVGLLALMSFALPLLVVQPIGVVGGSEAQHALALLTWSGNVAVLFPALAGFAGVLVALIVWAWDHEEGHVYALSLPLSRARYAFLKGSVGLVFAAVPVVVLGLTSYGALAYSELPGGVNAYPGAMTLRFGLAVLMAYALLFSMAAGTKKTTIRLLLGLTIGLALLALSGPPIAKAMGADLSGMDPATWVLYKSLEWPTPLKVFTGNWMLIDV